MYDFVYILQNIVNTSLNILKRMALGLIQKAEIQVDKIAKNRIEQAISQGWKEIQRVAAITIKIWERWLKNCIKFKFIC